MELIGRAEDGATIYTAARAGQAIGYVVVDSTVNGQSCGGLRLAADVDERELRLLARSMTLKYGLLGLPQGGAKAGVRGDPDAPRAQRLALLVEFAQAIGPLLAGRVFRPAADMGTEDGDIRDMLAAVGAPVGRRELRGSSSGDYTAASVMAAAAEAVRQAGGELPRCAAAVEGFGRVGNPLARLLAGAGAKVVAVSTSRGAVYDPAGLDVERLAALSGQVGSGAVEAYGRGQRLDRAALLELPADLLCPCARHHSVHAANASRIAARIICPGANNPVTEEAEGLLADRGVLLVPDFLANCGGVLGGTMRFAGVRPAKIRRFIEQRVGAAVGFVLEQARRTGQSPRRLAEDLALRGFERVKQAAEHPTPAGRLLRVGLELHRRGLVPAGLVGILAPAYFRRVLRVMSDE